MALSAHADGAVVFVSVVDEIVLEVNSTSLNMPEMSDQALLCDCGKPKTPVPTRLILGKGAIAELPREVHDLVRGLAQRVTQDRMQDLVQGIMRDRIEGRAQDHMPRPVQYAQGPMGDPAQYRMQGRTQGPMHGPTQGAMQGSVEGPTQAPAQGTMQSEKGVKVVVLFDPTTFSLFGEKVFALLRSSGIEAQALVLGDPARPFEPDEEAIERARSAAESGGALYIGVGSGAINDLGKYVSSQTGVPYVCVATAPSMDGFAAPISAINVKKVKTTVPSRCPDAVVADLDILCVAPAPMISAGFGDVLGKLTSLTDWKLAQILFDEHWCRSTADEVGAIARRVAQAAEAIAARTPEAISDLMKALFRAGTSVVHAGRSRPTSGGEHLFSHFVEMWHVNRGLRPPAHGHVVGVGTLLVAHIAQVLKSVSAPPRSVEKSGESVQDVLAALKIDSVPDNFGIGKYDHDQAVQRLERIKLRWREAVEAIAELPSPQEVKTILEKAGCPTRLSQLGLTRETAVQAIRWCRYLRERYTLFDLAADVGVLSQLVDELVGEYA